MKNFSIRIDEELLDKLHYVASYHSRSANSQVLHFIKQAVNDFEKENGKIEISRNRHRNHV